MNDDINKLNFYKIFIIFKQTEQIFLVSYLDFQFLPSIQGELNKWIFPPK